MMPLDVALLLERSGRDLPRNNAGMYVVTDTVPPTELTLAEYEAGIKLLDLRERVQRNETRR